MLLETQHGNPGTGDFTLPTDTDSDLKRRITTFLASQHRFALRLLEVEARSGEVTIRGCVSTFYEKQISVQLVRRVAGVVHLIDEVTVQSTPRQDPTEASTTFLQDSNRHSTDGILLANGRIKTGS